MLLLATTTPDTTAIRTLIDQWVSVGQALVGSIGALAFVFAFLWKMIAVDTRSVAQAKQWIQRIVVGTIGVEMAATLMQVITNSLPGKAG